MPEGMSPGRAGEGRAGEGRADDVGISQPTWRKISGVLMQSQSVQEAADMGNLTPSLRCRHSPLHPLLFLWKRAGEFDN